MVDKWATHEGNGAEALEEEEEVPVRVNCGLPPGKQGGHDDLHVVLVAQSGPHSLCQGGKGVQQEGEIGPGVGGDGLSQNPQNGAQSSPNLIPALLPQCGQGRTG